MPSHGVTDPSAPPANAAQPSTPSSGASPASVRHRSLVRETAAMFLGAEPFIQREIARKTWIYDIIEGRRESEHVFFNNDQFVILPDSDSQQPPLLPITPITTSTTNTNTSSSSPRVSILHWLSIFKDLSLRSIRDLRGHGGPDGTGHLSALRQLRGMLHELFPLQDTMMYFHYPPSVWQLHLHIAHPCDQLRTTNEMQKVHFLDDVILNLQIDPEYYAKATITYVLSSNHDLVRTYYHHQPHHHHHHHITSYADYAVSMHGPHHRRNNSSDEDTGSSTCSSLSSHDADHDMGSMGSSAPIPPHHNNTTKGAHEPRHPPQQKNSAPPPTPHNKPKHDGAVPARGPSNPASNKHPFVLPAPAVPASSLPAAFPPTRRQTRQTTRITPRSADPLAAA